MRGALGLDLVADDAAGEVVVDDPDRLHQRVGGRRADEAKAARLELLRQRLRLRRRRRDLLAGARRALGSGRNDQAIAASDSPAAASSRAARALAIAASIFARLRTMPASASSRSTSRSP